MGKISLPPEWPATKAMQRQKEEPTLSYSQGDWIQKPVLGG